MDRLDALERHWQNEPPVDVLVAGFVGFKLPKPKKAPKAKRKTGNNEAMNELASMFPDGVIKGS